MAKASKRMPAVIYQLIGQLKNQSQTFSIKGFGKAMHKTPFIAAMMAKIFTKTGVATTEAESQNNTATPKTIIAQSHEGIT